MTLGELRTRFRALLNRSDCDSTLATGFLEQGLARIQRIARLPNMERVHYLTGQATAVESTLIPSDLMQINDVFVNAEPVEKVSFRHLMTTKARYGAQSGQTQMYARVGASIFLWPAMAAQGELVVTYYGEFSPLTSDGAANEASTTIPDIWLYSALAFAGDYFKHDRATTWRDTAAALLTEANDAATQLDMTGGSQVITPAHEDY